MSDATWPYVAAKVNSVFTWKLKEIAPRYLHQLLA